MTNNDAITIVTGYLMEEFAQHQDLRRKATAEDVIRYAEDWGGSREAGLNLVCDLLALNKVRIQTAQRQLDRATEQVIAFDKTLCAQFKRRVPIEEELMECAKGKRPLPTKKDCARMAEAIGVPEHYKTEEETDEKTET